MLIIDSWNDYVVIQDGRSNTRLFEGAAITAEAVLDTCAHFGVDRPILPHCFGISTLMEYIARHHVACLRNDHGCKRGDEYGSAVRQAHD